MSNRKRARRRPVTHRDRVAFFSLLAAETGQTVEEVAEHIETAVRLGWLIETADGWQAAIPDQSGPVA